MDSQSHPAPARRRIAIYAAIALAWLGAEHVRADPTPPLGTVVKTFDYNTGSDYIALQPGSTQSGWDIREIVFTYNSKSDTLDVDVKTTGIAGDAYGKSVYDASNPANLGGQDSISIAFRSANDDHSLGNPIAIAGVPEYKLASGAGLDGFELAQFSAKPSNVDLQNSYGNLLTTAVGTLLYSPSAQNPDFEFTIQGFSKLYGLNMANGYYFSAYAGSPTDGSVGEVYHGFSPFSYVGPFQNAQTITSPFPITGQGSPPPPTPSPFNFNPVPEPASLVLYGVGGVGLWLLSRTRRSRAVA